MMESKNSGLPPNLETMLVSWQRWLNKSWNDTLAQSKQEIEDSLTKAALFDIWSNCLQDNHASGTLIPEIFIDCYMSIHFACWGLYKYANSCLRSQLETALRFIFFSTHQVEFGWWSEGNESYRSRLGSTDVWGSGYSYLDQLDNVKRFEEISPENRRLFAGTGRVSKIHRRLSTYVHSSVDSLQTKSEQFSPAYNRDNFYRWYDNFKEIQSCINILLILGFLEKFRGISSLNQSSVMNTGIENSIDRESIKTLAGI